MEARGLDFFVGLYNRYATSENKSKRTIETVAAAVKQFDRFLGGCHTPDRLKAEDLRRYILFLQQKERWAGHPTIKKGHGKLSPDAVACYIRSIKAFWSWLKRERFITRDPFKAVMVPKTPRKIVATFTPHQVTQLLKAIPHQDSAGYRDFAMVIALYGTAMRIGELTGLRLNDVHFDSGQLRVMGKGARERAISMTPTVYKALFKYANHWRPKVASDFFFVHENGRPLTRFYVDHKFEAWGRKAKISGVRCSPHTLRHTFSINLLRNGGDLFTLQRILGHSTLDMTRRYAQVSDRDVEITLKAHSPVEQLGIKV